MLASARLQQKEEHSSPPEAYACVPARVLALLGTRRFSLGGDGESQRFSPCSRVVVGRVAHSPAMNVDHYDARRRSSLVTCPTCVLVLFPVATCPFRPSALSSFSIASHMTQLFPLMLTGAEEVRRYVVWLPVGSPLLEHRSIVKVAALPGDPIESGEADDLARRCDAGCRYGGLSATMSYLGHGWPSAIACLEHKADEGSGRLEEQRERTSNAPPGDPGRLART